MNKRKRIWLLLILAFIFMALTAFRIKYETDQIGECAKDMFRYSADTEIFYETNDHASYLYSVTNNEIHAAYDFEADNYGLLCGICGGEGNIFVLAQKVVEGENVYDFLVLDKNFYVIAHSEYFKLAWRGEITDISYANDSIFFVQLGDSKEKGYKYQYDISKLIYGYTSKFNPNPAELSVWEPIETVEASIAEGSIVDMSLDQESIITYSILSSEQHINDINQEKATEVAKGAKFSVNCWVYRFITELIQCLLVLVVIIVLYFIIPIISKNRDRAMVFFVIWEVMLFVCSVFLWYGISFFKVGNFPGIIFLYGTFSGIVLFSIQSLDISNVKTALDKLVEGNSANIEKPNVYGADISHIWNSIIELSKRLDESNYKMGKVYGTYSKFAPKTAAAILNRESLVDVSSCESVELYSPIAIVNSNIIRDITQKSNYSYNEKNQDDILPLKIMELISHYQKKQYGFLAAMNGDMSLMKILFAKDFRQMDDFGREYIQLIKNYSKNRYSSDLGIIIIHTCLMKYGIVGNENQSVQYLHSAELSEIEENIPLLKKMGINFAITEEALQAEDKRLSLRYVGQMKLGVRKQPLEIYQILDSQPEKYRTQYQNIEKDYMKAIDEYMSGNFYEARNLFTEILRYFPDDGISRWYVHICEKRFNERDDEIAFNVD